jgi:predicted phage terminase large subunit-like protein
MPSSLSNWQRLEGESAQRQTIRSSLTEWAAVALAAAGQAPAAHHRLLIKELESLSHGETDRLMVLMPPGSAKSTYASVLFPAWWFTQHPRSSIIATSHTADLAEHFGRQVRNLVLEHGPRLGYELVPDKRSAGRWQTSCRGVYLAAGIRGPIIGHRADLAIIDDPIKSQAEADNPGFRDHVWGWYRSDLSTRLKPGARVLLIMTRWHEDDLGGRLLAQQRDQWRVLRLPALAEADDPLGRAPGAPLWPDWESAAELNRKRGSIGERAWSALFQQAPKPLEGGLFKVPRLEFVDAPPPPASGVVVRAWDLAATQASGGNDPDWTAGVKLLRDASGRYTVLDVSRLRGTPREVEAAIVAAARADGTNVTIGLPEDPGQAGKSQVSYLATLLTGYRITASRETGAKLTRAMPVASQIEAGNVALVRSAWTDAFLEELRDFPYGRKDDQVDALSRAFAMVTELGRPARRLNVPLLAR